MLLVNKLNTLKVGYENRVAVSVDITATIAPNKLQVKIGQSFLGLTRE